jgi:hypothetical protein
MSLERGERGPKGDHGQTGDEGERGRQGPRGSAGTELQHSLRTLTWATVILYLTVIILGFIAYIARVNDTNRTEELAVQTTTVICALRADLQARVDSTEKFLRTHPNGFAGISAEALEAQMEGQQRTIAALSTLPCPPTEVVGKP